MKKIQLKKVAEDLTFNGRCWPIKCLEGKWLTDEEPSDDSDLVKGSFSHAIDFDLMDVRSTGDHTIHKALLKKAKLEKLDPEKNINKLSLYYDSDRVLDEIGEDERDVILTHDSFYGEIEVDGKTYYLTSWSSYQISLKRGEQKRYGFYAYANPQDNTDVIGVYLFL